MAGFSLDKAPHSKPHFEGLEALIREEQKAAKGMFEVAKGTRLFYEALSEAASKAVSSADSAAAIAAPRSPAPGSGKPGGKGEAALDAGALTGAIRRAEAPLFSFGAHIDAIFDHVAGTITEGFRRIDSNTKFPTIDKAFKLTSNAVEDVFRFLSGRSKKVRDDVGGTMESLERSVKDLGTSMKGLAPAAQTGPLESGLKEVASSLGAIDGSLKTTADLFKTIADAAQPAAAAVRELQRSVADTAAVSPLLAKDFDRVNVPKPGKTPGLRDRKHPIIGLAPDPTPGTKGGGAAPDVVPARPAPALAAGYAGVMKSFASRGVAGAAKVGGAFQSLNAKVQAVKAKLDGIPVRRIIAVSGSALLAGKAVGRIVSAAGGVTGALSAIGAASVTAFGVTVKGSTLASAAFTALGVATGFGGLEMIAMAARGALAAAVLVKLGRVIYNAKFFTSAWGDVAGKTLSQILKGGLSLINPFNKATAAVNRTGSATAKVSASVKGMAAEIATGLGIFAVVSKAVGGVKDFFLGGIKGASDLNETVSAAKATFGDFSKVVEAQADAMARSYGLSKKTQIDVANGYGEMAQGAGMAEGASAKFANTFVKLAADFNSRNNFEGGLEEAAEKLQSALAGQSEPLRRYGVLIDEDAVKNYALAHGLATSSKAISDQAKFAARAALIQQGLASSNGDLEKTAGGAANQFRKAGGGLDNFATSIGQLLLPAVTSGANAFNELLAVVVDLFEANKPMIESWASKAEEAMGLVAAGVRNLGSVWTLVKDYAVRGVADAVAVIAVIPDNFSIICKYVGENWRSLWHDLVGVVASAIGNLYDNLTRVGDAIAEFFSDPTKGFHFDWSKQWRPMLEGFEATSAKFPGLLKPQFMGMSKDAQAAMDKIWADFEAHKKTAAGEAARAKKPAEVMEKEKAEKTRERSFAGLAEADSKEAYSATIRHRFGGREDGMKELAKTAEAQYDETKEQTALLKLIAQGGRSQFANDASLAILSL